MTTTHHTWDNGVSFIHVHTDKFKSGCLSLNFLTPLTEDTASANALIPAILRRGSVDYPHVAAVEQVLDEHYGSGIMATVRKKGEVQCLGFLATVLDERYTLDGSSVLAGVVQVLAQLTLHPVTGADGQFLPHYVEGERVNLIQKIRAQQNEKRQYAIARLVQNMCADEGYGVDRLGSERTAQTLTGDQLWQCYQSLLTTAPLQIYYCGSATVEQVTQALQPLVAQLPRRTTLCNATTAVRTTADTVRHFVDSMDVNQGKLTVGFRTGGVTLNHPQLPALLVLNALYGGTTTSKLFLNVRERRSLCYYASSMLELHKGLMLVASGVDDSQLTAAEGEIIAQFQACAKGEITDEELESGRRSVVSTLMTTVDGQGKLEEYWVNRSVAGLGQTPQALAALVEQVTVEQVTALAQTMALDSVHHLKGGVR